MEYVEPIRSKEKLEEMKIVMRKMSHRDYFLFMTGISTGLRISDILPLKVKDVRNKNHILIKEMKTKKRKKARITTKFRQVIDEYTEKMGDDDYLFPSKKTKKPIGAVQAWRIMQEASKKVGLENIGTHTLRKTFGYHFYKQTDDIVLLQELFNHSAPSVTLRYIGINQDVMDKAMDNFDI